MTTDQFYLLLCGFLGVAFHTLIKYKGLRSDAKDVNVRLTLLDFVKEDWVSIALSALSVLIWYFVFHEVSAKSTRVEDFSRVSFVTMGAIGSFIIQHFLSQAKKKIQKIAERSTGEGEKKPFAEIKKDEDS